MVHREARLIVERVRAEYLVPAAHPSPERVRLRLDEAIERDLAHTLGSALSPLLTSDDPSVWLIRELRVDVRVNAAWERERVARRCADRIARELGEKMAEARSGGGAGILWFEDRAAYLAHFLADLAAGNAWERWCYRSFDGLRPLPTSAALRTAIIDDPETGLSALARLDEASRETVMQALSGNDARRVLDGLTIGGQVDDDTAWAALLEAVQAIDADRATRGSEAHAALDLYVRACAARPQVSGPPVRDLALALARIMRLEREESDALRATVARGLAAGDLRSILSVSGADAALLVPLVNADQEQLRELANILRSKRRGDTDARARASVEPTNRLTRYGGIFLLLPFIADACLERAQTWPRVGRTSAPAALRLLLCARCLGGERAQSVLRDPVARDLFGVDASLSSKMLRRWSRAVAWRAAELLGFEADEPPLLRGRAADLAYLRVPAELTLARPLDIALTILARRALRLLAARLPGFAGAGPAFLAANVLEVGAKVEQEGEHWEVRLGRPPLQFILDLSGLARGERRIAWAPERIITFSQGD